MMHSDLPPNLGQIVEQTIDRWREGEAPDAAAVIARHPELGSRRTLALDLIHEELCLRKEKGDTIVPSTFIERFPEFRKSVARMLEVEEYAQRHPELADTLEETLWPRIGDEYLGFEVLEPLGRGALARVYLARELELGRRGVVIKVSQHGRREAQLLGKLAHDNIVTAHSMKFDAATGMTVICMPLLGTATALAQIDAAFPPPEARHAERDGYLTGEVIARAARQYQPAGLVKPESLADAFPFARHSYAEAVAWQGHELARGLAAAHAIGIVHRDIKPSNVLLAWSGRPMLLDFNLSTDLDEQTDRLGGTIAYMAPERIAVLLAGQAEQESTRDPRSDIFSLGVLLYELLTGRLPVQPAGAEQNDERSLRLWLQGRALPVAPPSKVCVQVDPPLDAIVLKCLAPQPVDRYATASDLARDLKEYLSPAATTKRWLVRHRRGVLAGALTTAAAMAGGFGWWWNLPPAYDRQYRLGVAHYEQGEYGPAIQAFSRALDERPDSVEALFARGQGYFWSGDLAAAQHDYRAAAALDPQPLYYFCAGTCALATDQGMQDLGQAKRLGYDPAAVECNIGLCFAYRGRHEQAINCFTKAIALNKQLGPAYLERGISRYTIGKIDEQTMHDFDEALVLVPRSRRLVKFAAILHAKAAPTAPSSRIKALDLIEELLRMGESRESLQKTPSLAALLDEVVKLAKPVAAMPPEPPSGSLPPKGLVLESTRAQLANYAK